MILEDFSSDSSEEDSSSESDAGKEIKNQIKQTLKNAVLMRSPTGTKTPTSPKVVEVEPRRATAVPKLPPIK